MPEAASRHQVQIGATTVTYLPDGAVHADPVALFPATTAQDWASHRHLLDANGWLVASVGSFLVRNDSGAALIDLGLGRINLEVRGVATYEGGGLMGSLHAEGLSAADIGLVLFTHLHRDHVGWTSDGTGGLTFPNARHLVDPAEWDHWQSHTEATGPCIRQPRRRRQVDRGALATHRAIEQSRRRRGTILICRDESICSPGRAELAYLRADRHVVRDDSEPRKIGRVSTAIMLKIGSSSSERASARPARTR